MRVPSSGDSPLMEGAKLVVRQLIDEPVKEAVREACAEERAAVEEPTESTQTTEIPIQEGDGSKKRRGRRITRLLVPVVGVAGAALLRRLRDRGSGTEDLVGGHDESRTVSVSDADLPGAGSSHRNRSSADETARGTGGTGETERGSPFGGDEQSDDGEEADESDPSPSGPT